MTSKRRVAPGPRLSPVERAKRNPRSLKWAVKAKCFVCCGGGQDEGIRERIRECTVVMCPLHGHRPYRDGHPVKKGSAQGSPGHAVRPGPGSA